MAADPAEAERRGRLVLLARDRLDRAARRLGDLRAPPERQADRRRGERVELELRAATAGSAKKMMKIVTRIGSPRQTSM